MHPTNAWLSQLVNFKNTIWTLEEQYAIKFCFKLGKMPCDEAGSTAMTQRPRDRVTSGRVLALLDPRRQDRANPPTNFWWSLFWTPLAWSTCTGVQEEILSEEASTLQIGSLAFPPGQCTSPQLHPCHRLFEQDGHLDNSSPSLSYHIYQPLRSGRIWHKVNF